MRFLFALLLFTAAPPLCQAQQLYCNMNVDTMDEDVRKAIHFLEDYFGSFSKEHVPDPSKYWSPKDCSLYKCPDQMIYGINTDYPTYSMKSKKTILYVRPTTEYIHIKTLFGNFDGHDDMSILCIANHYVRFDENGKPFFVNPVELNTKAWQTKTVRNIKFTYPPYHTFNQKKADSLVAKIIKLENEWSLKPINIRYYLADTHDELQAVRGFEYTCDMGNRIKPTGRSDDKDNIVYGGGWGENYFHEVVHIYLNRLYPSSPLKEGLAMFYGGSLGHPLAWHIRRLNDYLKQHHGMDLNKLGDLGYMDNFTNPTSTVLGLLCATAYRQHGLNGLKHIMTYHSLEEIFSEEFFLGRGEWHSFLRGLMDKY